MTKQDNAHSPLPWIVSRDSRTVFRTPDGSIIGGCRTKKGTLEEDRATAAFIVEACNSYYESKALISELVEALNKASNLLQRHDKFIESAMGHVGTSWLETTEGEFITNTLHKANSTDTTLSKVQGGGS